MSKFLYIGLFVLLGLISNVKGQVYSPNTDGNYTTCSGTFYDSGGANNNYGNGQNYTVTFCSGNGQPLYLNFSTFNLQGGFDFLLIYAGNNTSAAQIGSYSANSPGIVTSANGCITIKFVSNNSNSNSGWAAVIGCGTPPTNNVTMSNGSTSSCNSNFYDNGGPNNNYSNNQNLTYTFSPITAGSLTQVSFSSFNLQNNDFLQVFNGPNTSSPSLGIYTGNSSPGLIQATPSNATGSLTFLFASNGNGTTTGWAANVSCFTPCQVITSNFLSSSPSPEADGIIRICAGQTVTFNGSGTFSQSGVGANYNWNFGNGTLANGATATATYTSVGTYFVDLNITNNGCTNGNNLNKIVQVASPPTITSSANPLVLCQGLTSIHSGAATNSPFVYNCTTPYSGLTYLPDGNGVTYTTSIPVDCYNANQTIQSASDISDICLTMEHSYLGDLKIVITCPNGQSSILKSYPGGAGTYLGCPLDDPAVGPGEYRAYCFTPSATTLLVNGATSNCGSPISSSINSGNYMPVQSFTNLVGCPINGNWTITVTDNLNLDNGYIDTWDINFNPNIQGVSGSFTPSIVSQGWANSSGLTTAGSNDKIVTASSVGQICNTYSATNNYGCTTEQVQCIHVTQGVVPTFPQVGPYCQGTTAPTLPTTSTNGIIGIWSSPIEAVDASGIIYDFTPTSGQCASPTTMTIEMKPTPIANIIGATLICSGSTTTVEVAAIGGTAPFIGTGSFNVSPGTYTYVIEDAHGCSNSISTTINAIEPIELSTIIHN